jgi:hypothetical protein
MAQPLNLLAREHFKIGDPGYILGEGVRLGDGVRKLTGDGLPRGAIRVTAIEDVEAWTNGHFQEATPTRGQRTGKRTIEAIERDSAALLQHSRDLRDEAAELNRTAKDSLSTAARLKKELAKQKRP